MSSPASTLSSTGSGSGAASESTSSAVAMTSISPVGRSGFSLPAGRRATSPMTLTQNSLRRCVRVLLAEDHLHDPGGVAQVDEDDPAVVAAAGHPAGQRHGRAGVRGAQASGVMGTDHGGSSPRGCGRARRPFFQPAGEPAARPRSARDVPGVHPTVAVLFPCSSTTPTTSSATTFREIPSVDGPQADVTRQSRSPCLIGTSAPVGERPGADVFDAVVRGQGGQGSVGNRGRGSVESGRPGRRRTSRTGRPRGRRRPR